jgi:hypothetical protein
MGNPGNAGVSNVLFSAFGADIDFNKMTRPRPGTHQSFGHAPNLPLDNAHAPEARLHSNQR